jgi:hypothetical protein
LKTEHLLHNQLFIRFNEIIKGFSERRLEKETIYIKHLSNDERCFLYSKYQEFFDYAGKLGLPSEKDALEKAIDDDFWSEKNEKEIKTSQDFIERMKLTKKNLFKQRDIEVIEKDLKAEEEKLRNKLEERREILGKTKEDYAANRSNDYVLYLSLYKNISFTEKYFDLEYFEEMSHSELGKYILFYNEFYKEFDDLCTQRIALADFYKPYYIVLDSPNDFLGKPLCEFTELQTRVLIYGKVFKNIFENNENIPEKIMNDPEELLKYVDKTKAEEKFNKSRKKSSANSSAEMVFGTSKDEISKSKDTKMVNDVMKEKKNLTMEELMKLHGEM